jgi:hypothetical protein
VRIGLLENWMGKQDDAPTTARKETFEEFTLAITLCRNLMAAFESTKASKLSRIDITRKSAIYAHFRRTDDRFRTGVIFSEATSQQEMAACQSFPGDNHSWRQIWLRSAVFD